MHELSPLAWAAITVVIVIFVITNLGLVAFLRYKPQLKMKPPTTQDRQKMERLVSVLKDPFGEQRKQMDELSGLVNKLEKPDDSNDKK